MQNHQISHVCFYIIWLL